MINYKIVGDDPNKDTIVFLSGLGANVHFWDRQLELADEFNLAVFDFTKDYDGEITLESVVVELNKILDKMNVNKVHIVGNSMGGIVAQFYYHMYPDKIKSLVLANSISFVVDELLKCSIEDRKRKLERMSDEEYIDDLVQMAILHKYDDVLQEASRAFTINRNTYEQMASLMLGKDLTYIAREIKVPTLIVLSMFDSTTPPGNQILQRWLISNSELYTMWCGHLSNIECSSEFNRVVRNFLKKC